MGSQAAYFSFYVETSQEQSHLYKHDERDTTKKDTHTYIHTHTHAQYII